MISELLSRRFSVRQFEERPVPAEVVRDMLEAARLSPSGGNEQSWLFGVLTDPVLIAQAAETACQQTWLASAPLLVVLCTIIVDEERGGRDIQVDRYPEYAAAIRAMDAGLYAALNQEEHQTKIAGTHMALAALEHGVGCCWVSRFQVARLARLLELPEGVLPAEILAFGYPRQARKMARKKGVEEITFYNKYRKA